MSVLDPKPTLKAASVSKFALVVNLKAAKALGVEFPKATLFRADEIIQ